VHSKLLTEDEYATKLFEVERFFSTARVLGIDQPLLHAASRRLPVRLATLDAIHLATAERFRAEFDEPFVFATHDGELAAAARAAGFDVIGSAA
jgi:predicted nucleic acid-binding protein